MAAHIVDVIEIISISGTLDGVGEVGSWAFGS